MHNKFIEGSSDPFKDGNSDYLWFGTWAPSNENLLIDDPHIASELSASFTAEYEIKFLIQGGFFWLTSLEIFEENPYIGFNMWIHTYIIITKKNYQGEKTKVFNFGEKEKGLEIDLYEEEIAWCSELEMQDMEIILEDGHPGIREKGIKKLVSFDFKIPSTLLGLGLSEKHRKNELLEFNSSNFKNKKGNIKFNLTGKLLKESERDANVDFPFNFDFYLSEFVFPFLINGVDIKVMNQGNITGNGWIRQDFDDCFWEGFYTLGQINTEKSKDSVFIEYLKTPIDFSELLDNLGCPFRDINKTYAILKKKIDSTRSSLSNVGVRQLRLEKYTGNRSNNRKEAGVAVNNSSSRPPSPSIDQRSSPDDSK